MKILQCHNLYQMPGGEDRVVEDERQLLEDRGHQVITYTLHNDDVAQLSKPRLAAGTIWSRRSAAQLADLVRRHRPDIAHFHNTLPLMSPAAYSAVRKLGVPVVQTLHNYRLLCPKATFFRDGKICEDCLDKSFKWPAIRHACYREDRAASATIAVMLSVHGQVGTYRRAVDAYIACSEFTREKMIQGGYPGQKIHYKPNFVPHDPGVGGGRGGYPLYLGRLSPEKGIDVLTGAWDRLAQTHQNHPETPLHIVGQGPDESAIEQLQQRQPQVHHETWVSEPRLGQVLGDAGFLVLPTMNYEGFPKVIVEAYAHGLPVVATDVGAMSHVVQDGVTGRRFPYGDAEALARIVAELLADPEQLARLRRGARAAYEQHYTADANYRRLMQIYRQAREVFDRSAASTTSPSPDREVSSREPAQTLSI